MMSQYSKKSCYDEYTIMNEDKKDFAVASF